MFSKFFNASSESNFKFLHLKTFSSNEGLFPNGKKYRSVFDELEACYIYAEFAIYNKQFDRQDWQLSLDFVCTNEQTKTQECKLSKKYTVSKDTNIFQAREGWGTPNPNWWRRGKYRWDVYMGNQLLASTFFYITSVGLVSTNQNPFWLAKSVRLFESDVNGASMAQRLYLKTFAINTTRYVNVELTLDLLTEQRPLPLEIQFDYYNSLGQLRGQVVYFWELTDDRKSIVLDTGFGANAPGFWTNDTYTLNIVFMDTLIGSVIFDVADQSQTEALPIPLLTPHKNKTLLYDIYQIQRALLDVKPKVKAIRQIAVEQIFAKQLQEVDDSTRTLIEKMLEYMEQHSIAIPWEIIQEKFST